MKTYKKHYETAKVISQTRLADDIFALTLETTIAREIKAGQFVMVYLDRGELLLPRPISVCQALNDEIQLVYYIAGKGTACMSRLQAGQTVRLLGALGNGFILPDNQATKKYAVVGGGIGVPPLLMLAQNLRAAQVDVYLGFKSQPILAGGFEPLATNVRIATDDGSFGSQGTVMDILDKETQYDEIFACGPKPMLRALALYAESADIPIQVCMEERMACGLGTCVGCAIKTNCDCSDYQKVCTDGPVFYGKDVDWHV
jgi:dihydroorotate dehydrogenase electron transfer subunit